MNTLLGLIAPVADNDWGMHGDFGDGWGIVMTIVMVLFWATILVLAIWFARSAVGSRTPDQRAPLEVLQHRLARGEISAEDYERLREKLSPPG
ncbi:MAG: SHOCT domain-containing protein [Solirubrobacterales bacterium]